MVNSTGGNTEFADVPAAHAEVPLSQWRLEREGSTGRTPDVLGRRHRTGELARHDPRNAPARGGGAPAAPACPTPQDESATSGHRTMREALPIVSP